MVDRRQFLLAGPMCFAASLLAGCDRGTVAHREAAAVLRRPLPGTPDETDFVRYATLAANSHNTQPWRFRVDGETIDILPDFTRRTPVVDPDNHHLFASLGCAAENLSLAARARGRDGAAELAEEGEGVVRVSLKPAGKAEESALFQAIPMRQCTRAVYTGERVGRDALSALEKAAVSPRVDVLIMTDRPEMEEVLELAVAGNGMQFADPDFRSELKEWIRFNAAQAVEHGDGLYTRAGGNPAVPAWLGAVIFDRMITPDSENGKVAEQIRSSAGIAVFIARENDPAHWIEAGRAYQRFALQATALGLKHAFINQTVEVAAQREALANYLGMPEGRPNLVVRFGTGTDLPYSLRRPVEEIMVTVA